MYGLHNFHTYLRLAGLDQLLKLTADDQARLLILSVTHSKTSFPALRESERAEPEKGLRPKHAEHVILTTLRIPNKTAGKTCNLNLKAWFSLVTQA